MTFQEIADELGISRQRVDQIYRNAIRKMAYATSRATVRSLVADTESRRQYARSNGPRGPRDGG